MSDIIKEALDEWSDEKEREAVGNVEGHRVRLVKEEYQMQQRGPTSWKVGVYIDGNGPLAEKQEKEMEPNEAQDLFDELVERYSLTESPK